MPTPSYDVFIITGKNTDGSCEFHYVAATSADMGEIVASCQVLFPDMMGITIEPFDKDRETA